MLSSQYNQMNHDVVQHIIGNFTYPAKNEYQSTHLFLSHDIGSTEVIQTMVQIHNLVGNLAKSVQEAVKLETTIDGKSCLGITLAGEALYCMLLQPHRVTTPLHQQLSEELKSWEEIVQRILGSSPNFEGKPMHRMNTQGVTEAELLNAFLIRLREATGRKIYKSECVKRNKEAQRAYNAQTKLVTRLLENHPGLVGLRIALMYSQDHAGKVRLRESAEHFQKLLEVIKDDLWLRTSVGFTWTRHFLSEAGYRYNLVLLFDPNITPLYAIDGSHVLREWQVWTNGAGLDYVLPDNWLNANELLHEIECAKAAAQYLRLIPDAKFPHFGVSELPSAKSLSELEQNPPSSVEDRGEFGGNHRKALSTPLNKRF